MTAHLMANLKITNWDSLSQTGLDQFVSIMKYIEAPYLLLLALTALQPGSIEASFLLKGLGKNLGGLAGGGGGGGVAQPIDYCCKQVMQIAPPFPWLSSVHPEVPKEGEGMTKGKKKGKGAGGGLLASLGLGGLF